MYNDSIKIAQSLGSREVELIQIEDDGSVSRTMVNEGSLLKTIQLCERYLENDSEEHPSNLNLMRHMAQNAESLLANCIERDTK